jgi:hypothetical protein
LHFSTERTGSVSISEPSSSPTIVCRSALSSTSPFSASFVLPGLPLASGL